MEIMINCDMGESFGIYKCGEDEKIMPFINLANIACGFHASDPIVMQTTVRLAKHYRVNVGAHPSYPDLQGFGRREMKMTREELSAFIIYQIGALKAFLEAEGMKLHHIKPHGALYGVSARDETVAHAICDAAEVFDVPLLGMPGTTHEHVYTTRGIPFFAEYYADLDYADDGSLIITKKHEAKDPIAVTQRAIRALSEGKVTSINGKDISITRIDSICLHSDTPDAENLAKTLYTELKPWLIKI